MALLQLASARTALLVRTCRMRFKLPPALVAFLRRVCIAPSVWLPILVVPHHGGAHRSAVAAQCKSVVLCVVHLKIYMMLLLLSWVCFVAIIC